MGLSEKYDRTYNELKKICSKNDLEFSIHGDGYPVEFCFTRESDYQQIDFFEGTDKVTEQESSGFHLIFKDSLSLKMDGNIELEFNTLKQIKNVATKLHYAYLDKFHKKSSDR